MVLGIPHDLKEKNLTGKLEKGDFMVIFHDDYGTSMENGDSPANMVIYNK